jgi:hypothetical protein
MPPPTLALTAGAGLAAASIPLAAVAGGPYLSLESLSPWLVTFAVGLFVALFAIPFALHAGIGGLLEDDARWERALLWWGAVTLGVLAIAVVVGGAAGFDGDSLAGSLGAVAATEALLVLATLIVWLISG